jgi:hypothetical protein
LDEVEDTVAVGVLTSYGFGKGTLSRNVPNFRSRVANGTPKATRDSPFATPKRFVSPAHISTSMDTLSIDIADLSILQSNPVENLQLGWEEALYLTEKLNSISVFSTGSDSPLNPQSLCQKFTTVHSNFLEHYYGMDIYCP